jgi:hypothetical protein
MTERAATKRPAKRPARKVGKAAEKAADTPTGETTKDAFYVYCAGMREALGGIFEAGGLPEAVEDAVGLELIAAGELAAAASAVPLSVYGEEALAAHLTDAAWTATRAFRHERVVQHFAERAPVVPFRFATIYLTRGSVAHALEAHEAPLRRALGRVEGREEWGVNLYVERERLRAEVVRTSALLRDLDAKAAAATPGQAFLLRKKIEASRETEARAKAKRVASKIEAELLAASDDAARLRTVRDERTEYGEVAARFAFLVARERFAEFRAAAERLADEHALQGFRLELTGPWPAYNFVAFGAEDRNAREPRPSSEEPRR